MRRLFATLLAAVAWTAAAQAPVKAPARIALVIGNAAYPSAPLANPLNDAADMAKELEAAGFTVIRRENAKLRDMHLALREFGDKLGKTSEALAWYDRGIDYERAYRRHMVAESKAAYLYAGGRGAEALSLYESLVRERSLGEAEKQRLAHNVESLRAELAKR